MRFWLLGTRNQMNHPGFPLGTCSLWPTLAVLGVIVPYFGSGVTPTLDLAWQ